MLGLSLVSSEWGLLFVVAPGRLVAVASLISEHRLNGMQASAIVVHGLNCSVVRGIIPDQVSNLCPCIGTGEVHVGSLSCSI